MANGKGATIVAGTGLVGAGALVGPAGTTAATAEMESAVDGVAKAQQISDTQQAVVTAANDKVNADNIAISHIADSNHTLHDIVHPITGLSLDPTLKDAINQLGTDSSINDPLYKADHSKWLQRISDDQGKMDDALLKDHQALSVIDPKIHVQLLGDANTAKAQVAKDLVILSNHGVLPIGHTLYGDQKAAADALQAVHDFEAGAPTRLEAASLYRQNLEKVYIDSHANTAIKQVQDMQGADNSEAGKQAGILDGDKTAIHTATNKAHDVGATAHAFLNGAGTKAQDTAHDWGTHISSAAHNLHLDGNTGVIGGVVALALGGGAGASEIIKRKRAQNAAQEAATAPTHTRGS